MDPQRWEKIERLYHLAREREAGEREKFLEETCAGDESLRRDVESLLACPPEGQDFLEAPALEVAARVLAKDKAIAPPADLTGRTIAHYRVLEKIGQGGMGEVFLADDTSLHRKVALKFLPPALQQDPVARKRFIREARSAAALDHPFICHINEVAESDGQDFIVMEYVDGQSLKDKLVQGPLSLEDMLQITIEVTEALEAAHGKGIVHRDIKPGNVMLTQTGHAKVMDFGLAKQVVPSGERESEDETITALTADGSAVGTLAYMSPEQLRGQAADGRSDIWALGVTLYEMAASVRPFHGQSGFELTSAILHQAPRPLPSHVPAELGTVIERCLEKEPSKRYQKADEVRAALERIRGGTVAPWAVWRYRLGRRRWLASTVGALVLLSIVAALSLDWLRTRFWGGMPRIQSLAVLPLENLSGDKEQEYFADGMTEELITDLAKIRALKVISRTSVMQFKGTNKPLPQIAKELNVDALIEGSVLREGGQVRITAQLIHASTEQNLWAESYQRDLRSVLALQGEIASAIADKVRAVVTPIERARLASARPVNPDAYEAYLKGMQCWYRFTPQDIDNALEYFELALKKDPNYAPAHSGVALVWIARNQMGYKPPREAGPKAKAAALKAVELDNAIAQAHSSLAIVKGFYDWDWAGADVEFKKAIELNPNYPDARAMYSHYLVCMKRPEEAMAQIQGALELDPLNDFFRAFYGVDLEFMGRYDEAIPQFRKALKTSPGIPFAHWGLGGTLFMKGLYEEVLAEFKAVYDYIGAPQVGEALTQGYAQSGFRGGMRRAAEALAAQSRKSYVAPNQVAELYAMAGEKDQALKWLEKAFEVRDPNMPYANVDPTYDLLRSDPRFQDLLRRKMNLPE
jgi:serine/threonine protein kinase/tetratricopeptide (TPR) repeat protein